MNKISLHKFLKALNADNVSEAGGWVKASCLFAPWKHQTGKDANPSFGIKIEDKKESHFNCWACNKGGSLETLLLELVHLTRELPTHGIDFKTAFKLLEDEEVPIFTPSDWSEFAISAEKFKFQPWGEHFLNSFTKASLIPKAVEYLEGRGFNTHTELITEFDVRYDLKRNTVAFPFRNAEGVLAGMRGRYIDPLNELRYHDYLFYAEGLQSVNNTKGVWFNEHKIDWEKTIVLAEGVFDVVSIYKHYQNVMSPLSTSMTVDKINKLKQAVKVVCFFDNDMAGDNAYEKVKDYLKDTTVVLKVKYPANTPPKVDANDLPEYVVKNLLSNYVNIN